MAPTRPATDDPTPRSAPTTQNNGIKKAPKPSEQHLYIVSRETFDPHGTRDKYEINPSQLGRGWTGQMLAPIIVTGHDVHRRQENLTGCHEPSGTARPIEYAGLNTGHCLLIQ
ncbi:hypothetical protein VE03_05786 [Pseudogymnoascus sp. 23342-1-I1]|nr:hypothetical protein VE03_05786 [Pseudogymnoascus sp. 23342-1-I1]